MTDWPLQRLLEMEGMPDWLRGALPFIWLVLLLASVGALAYAVSVAIKRLVRHHGRRRVKDAEGFEGSAWDLAGSLAQFAVLVSTLPVFLDILGLAVTLRVGGIVAAAVVLVAGFAVATWVSASIRSFGERASRARKADATLFNFAGSIVKYAVLAFAVIFALQQVGFQTTSLVAIVGAAGLAIALALQDTLKAVASGLMLAIFRPFRIGDWVSIAGAEGEVVEISPFHTTLKGIDNKAIIIPNDKAWADPVLNYSRYPRRRLDLYFDVAYEDDVGHALETLRAALASVPRVLAKDEIWTGVHELGSYSVRLRARPWIATPEFLDRRSDCIRAVLKAFDAEGITIPYPRQTEFHGSLEDRNKRPSHTSVKDPHES